MKQGKMKVASPVLVAAVFGTVSWVNAGQLTPPLGGISPTGPTTINGQDWNANLPVAINQSGSYILTSNIVAPAGYTGHGINISVNGVTLDLRGFSVIGVTGSSSGIYMPSFRTNIVIKNGHVREWGKNGIEARMDIGRIESITATLNGGWGITNAGAWTTHIISCEAYSNGGDVANTGGIRGDSRSKIVDCLAFANTDNGIRVGVSSLVTDCVSTSNTVGIAVASNSLIKGNTCNSNSIHGIQIGGSDIRIEGNNVTDNGIGIWASTGGNIIIKNSASGNTTNYSIVGGNAVGQIITVSSSFSTSNAWCNFSY